MILLTTITRNSDKKLILRQKTSSDKAEVVFFGVFSPPVSIYVKKKVYKTIPLREDFKKYKTCFRDIVPKSENPPLEIRIDNTL